MKHFHKMISGIPYGKSKKRGDVEAPNKWTEAVIKQTEVLPKITDTCIIRVTFLLPKDKYPPDFFRMGQIWTI